jgi:biopolymer transport protein ExbD
MGGISLGDDGGRGRAVDREINMVPFIDLLLVTISFLLVTSVWSSMSGLSAHGLVPHNDGERDAPPPETELEVYVSSHDQRARLEWRTGDRVEEIATVDLLADASGHYANLESEVAKAYAVGVQRRWLDGDEVGGAFADRPRRRVDGRNRAVLHVDNASPFREVARIIDAIGAPRRHVCGEPRPRCCGLPDSHRRSTEGCETPAAEQPAFDLQLSAR